MSSNADRPWLVPSYLVWLVDKAISFHTNCMPRTSTYTRLHVFHVYFYFVNTWFTFQFQDDAAKHIFFLNRTISHCSSGISYCRLLWREDVKRNITGVSMFLVCKCSYPKKILNPFLFCHVD